MRVRDAEAMEALGARIAGQLQAGDVLLLSGPLGAGKTTLTRGIGAGLGARGTVQSPTFVLARTHKTSSGPKLVHVDAYRLQRAIEFDDLDIDFAGSVVVVEWPRDYLQGLMENWIDIEISRGRDDEVRELVLRPVGERWLRVWPEIERELRDVVGD